MQPRDWFGVSVRLLGLWAFYQGFGNLTYFAAARLGLSLPWSAAGQLDLDFDASTVYLFYAACQFSLAVFLLLKVDWITAWAFDKPEYENDVVDTVEPPSADGQ
jgi:hypothetical protein